MITKISKKKKVLTDGESFNQFDNIIYALYQIQEKCYTLYEFEVRFSSRSFADFLRLET